MPRDLFVNNAPTTLATAITSTSSTTISVTSGDNFPKIGNFRILIGSEIMIVTNVTPASSYTPATWTVTRGAEGTTAATHAVDKAVNFLITQANLRNYFVEGNRTGNAATYANITPPQPGDIFFPQNSYYTCVVYTKTGWKFFCSGREVFPPKVYSEAWIRDSQPDNNTTLIDTPVANIMFNNAPAYSVHMYYRIAPSTPYTITMACLPQYFYTGYSAVGLGWRSSDAAPKYSMFTVGINNSSSLITRFFNWTNYSTYGGDVASATTMPSWMHGSLVWMRIRDDGTNRLTYWSSNGHNWTLFAQTPRTTFLTPTYIGVFLADNGTGNEFGNTIVSMQIT